MNLEDVIHELEIPHFTPADVNGRYWLAKAITREAQREILEWAMRLCHTGSTPSMIRLALHNKLTEITGEGEKA